MNMIALWMIAVKDKELDLAETSVHDNKTAAENVLVGSKSEAHSAAGTWAKETLTK